MTFQKTRTKTDDARAYWLGAKELGQFPSLSQAAAATGFSTAELSRIRTQLVRQGQLPQPIRSFRGAKKGASAPRELLTAPVQEILEKPLTPEEQRMQLSTLSATAGREETKVAALSALRQLDLAQGVKQEGGPGRPLTDEEFEERIEAIFAAIPEQFLYKFERKVSDASVRSGSAGAPDEERTGRREERDAGVRTESSDRKE